MNGPAVFGALLVLALPPVTAAAQQPDFSGTWTLDEPTANARPSVATVGDAAFRRGDMGSGWGARLTIAQSATQLSVEYAFFSTYDLQPPIRLVYALDGSESRNSVMIGHSASEQRSRAEWLGTRLVITTTHPVPGGSGTATTLHALSLESPATLVLETTRMGAAGSAPGVTRSVYRKG